MVDANLLGHTLLLRLVIIILLLKNKFQVQMTTTSLLYNYKGIGLVIKLEKDPIRARLYECFVLFFSS